MKSLSIVFIALVLSGCGGFQEDPRDQSYEVRTASKYRAMVTAVAANKTVTVTGAGLTGVFVEDRVVILGAYSIAKYETTWELWKEVYDWAAAHGYSIANTGMEGHGEEQGTGSEGTWSAASRKSRPVTGVTWRDTVVWCNAYSELSGLDPVYYTEGGGAVLRVSKNNGASNPSDTATEADLVTAMRGNNGFRLPTEAEWEFAARGGATSEDAWNSYNYAGSNDPGSVAWYDANAAVQGSSAYGAHAVGTKAANRLGIFDLSGNAAEWCWDWLNENPITKDTPPDGDGPGTFAHRLIRGGGWNDNNDACKVRARGYCRPFSSTPNLGFRVARTIPDTGDVENSGDYPASLVGTQWFWDSPFGSDPVYGGMRVISFYEDGYAFFFNYGNPFDDYYTYDPGRGTGNIGGGYPAGDFQLRNNNTVMYFPAYKNYGHSAEFYRMEWNDLYAPADRAGQPAPNIRQASLHRTYGNAKAWSLRAAKRERGNGEELIVREGFRERG